MRRSDLRGLPWRRLTALGMVLVLLAAMMVVVPMPDADSVRDTVSATGAWAPLTWLGLMVACTQLPIPGPSGRSPPEPCSGPCSAVSWPWSHWRCPRQSHCCSSADSVPGP
ncbi:hypothetical protein ACTXMA_03265 [Corynebacterium variabile]|uniref:hypothetical protein n=1 Tax=Corynebacterium variabile TaxID=1727 RepID=UPI003FD3FDA9